FFFNAPASTDIYTLSLHDALPISYDSISPCALHLRSWSPAVTQTPPLFEAARCTLALVLLTTLNVPFWRMQTTPPLASQTRPALDRKSTRLNSSHLGISYAVFCLK